jgi:predicted DCC family thiol-disulfide oxidoreductase YuxK
MVANTAGHPLLLFDSECVMCSRLVPWILRHERDQDLYFSALRSEAAAAELARHGVAEIDYETMYVVEGRRVYVRSDAVAKMAAHLGWPWRLAAGIALVPRPLRDLAYRFVARHRYRWFGTRDRCDIPQIAAPHRLVS